MRVLLRNGSIVDLPQVNEIRIADGELITERRRGQKDAIVVATFRLEAVAAYWYDNENVTVGLP